MISMISWDDVINVYRGWFFVVLLAITVILALILYVIRSTQPEEYIAGLPESPGEALAIVGQITQANTSWRIQDVKQYFSDKDWAQIKYLGYIVDIIEDGGSTRFSLHFPQDHPDQETVSNFCPGEFVVFERLLAPLDEANPNNPTSYVVIRLA